MSTAHAGEKRSEPQAPLHVVPELGADEQDMFETGPFSLLTEATKGHLPVLIALRNNHKLVARVKAFDRHFNMVLENVHDMWFETVKTKGADDAVERVNRRRERFVPKMFLRGDGVIIVTLAPSAEPS
jgi:small nuclear ribonucleoprotein D2